MSFGWNWLGILVWVGLALYFLFIVQNIRKRHLKMIVNDRKRFEWQTLILDILEIGTLLAASTYMFAITVLADPALNDAHVVSTQIDYRPLILRAGAKQSYYVIIRSSHKTRPVQAYTVYYDSRKVTVSSHYATISSDKDPLSLAAKVMPYSRAALQDADIRYQRAYTAVYTARYHNNWHNGLALHAGRIALRYYLIRIPDETFVREG